MFAQKSDNVDILQIAFLFERETEVIYKPFLI